MYAVLALPFLICNLAFADQRKSPTVQAEREVLEQMNQALGHFIARLETVDSHFENLRSTIAAQKWQKARDQAATIKSAIPQLRSRWQALESLYTDAVARELNLNRLVHDHFLGEHPDLENYIAMQVNNRFEHGSPIPILAHYWQSLQFGKKVETPSSPLFADSTWMEGPIRKGSYILIHLINGGLVRGHVEGWTRKGRLVLREIMPLAFVRFQKQIGLYRTMEVEDWKLVASVEVFVVEKGNPPVTAPVDRFGNYTPAFLAAGLLKGKRIYVQPTNWELLSMARKGEPKQYRSRFSVTEIDFQKSKRPDYATLPFLGCEELLASR